MGILPRLLLVAGILCLGMNFFGVVASYYSTVHYLSQGDETAVDTLTDRIGGLQRNPWPLGWTVLGVALIATAIILMIARGKRRSR